MTLLMYMWINPVAMFFKESMPKMPWPKQHSI